MGNISLGFCEKDINEFLVDVGFFFSFSLFGKLFLFQVFGLKKTIVICCGYVTAWIIAPTHEIPVFSSVTCIPGCTPSFAILV